MSAARSGSPLAPRPAIDALAGTSELTDSAVRSTAGSDAGGPVAELVRAVLDLPGADRRSFVDAVRAADPGFFAPSQPRSWTTHAALELLSTELAAARVDGSGVEAAHMLAQLGERLFGIEQEPVRLGRFVIVDRLGSGGMGVVYRAYDPELDRKVALKLLRAGDGQDPAADQRLRREAQAMARLAHPNVVAVHEVGTWQGRLFLAMELVDGGTISDWRNAERPSWTAIVDRYVDAGRGLAAAHEAGLIHRDFKPENVLVGADGRVRVADFGLVRRRWSRRDLAEPSPDEPRAASALDASMTTTGAQLGTPAYMAPEQIDGERSTEKTDQFSFCVALYQALFHIRPFVGRDLQTVRRRMRTGELEPPRAGEAVPSRVREALHRGLKFDPDERWPSMEALLDELVQATRPRPRRWRRAGAAAGMGLAAVAIVVAAIASRGDDSAAPERERGDRGAGSSVATANALVDDGPAASAGPRQVDRPSLAAGRDAAPSDPAGTPGDGTSARTLSPDRRRVLTRSSGGTIEVRDADRPAAHPPLVTDRGDAAWFSPDGSRVLVAGLDEFRLWRLHADGASLMARFPAPVTRAYRVVANPWQLLWKSPDGVVQYRSLDAFDRTAGPPRSFDRTGPDHR